MFPSCSFVSFVVKVFKLIPPRKSGALTICSHSARILKAVRNGQLVVSPKQWACGAAGSALPWHGRGRRFDPDQVHQISQQLRRGSARDRGVCVMVCARPRMQRRPELIVGIVIWTFSLRGAGLIVQALDAVYYCGDCYTTLGMGKVDVGEHWRIITPIIGISADSRHAPLPAASDA